MDFSQRIFQIFFRTFLVVGSVVLCVPVASASDIDLNDGLVGYWNFDGSDTNWTSPTTGTTADKSGKGNTGTMINMSQSTSPVPGKMGQGLLFDGSDDYVNAGSNVSLKPDLPISISFWINPITWASRGIISYRETRNHSGFWVDVAGLGGVQVSYGHNVACDTWGRRTKTSPDSSIALGKWQYVVIIIRGATDMSIYVNGVDMGGTYSGTGDSISYESGFLRIGSVGGISPCSGSFFSGNLDEVRIYNRALSEEEIEALQDSYSDPSTLTVTVPLESTTTHRNFIPIEFTVKTSLFPKRTPDGLFSNKMRVQLDDRFPITIRYDRDEEDEDDGITYSIWKGVYNKPKGVSNIPFHITGTLEMANCDKNTGEKIPFNIQQETRGTYTIQKTLQDDEIVTKTDFISLETPTPLPIECPSFFQKPISFLGCFFFGYSSEEPSLAETETTTAYASIDEDDETMDEARAMKLCKKPVEEIFICGASSVLDEDGNVYGTVQVGTQCWMNKNMNVGTRIAGSSNQTNNGIIEKYCYGNNESYCTSDGGLYQWNEAMQYSTTEGARGICPAGWHIPRDSELYTLENYLKDNGQTCDPLRSDMFGCATAGTNLTTGTSGMVIPLAGYRHPNGSLDTNRTTAGYVWSSSYSYFNAWCRSVYLLEARVYRYAYSLTGGFSVRCLKD